MTSLSSKPISFFVAGVPKGQPRPRAFARKFGAKWSARMYDPGTAEEFKSRIAAELKPFLPATPIEGPVELRCVFQMPRPKVHHRSNGELKPTAPSLHIGKPDLDNLEKAVMDTLTQSGYWRDDSQVARKVTVKTYAEMPGLYLTVTPLEVS